MEALPKKRRPRRRGHHEHPPCATFGCSEASSSLWHMMLSGAGWSPFARARLGRSSTAQGVLEGPEAATFSFCDVVALGAARPLHRFLFASAQRGSCGRWNSCPASGAVASAGLAGWLPMRSASADLTAAESAEPSTGDSADCRPKNSLMLILGAHSCSSESLLPQLRELLELRALDGFGLLLGERRPTCFGVTFGVTLVEAVSVPLQSLLSLVSSSSPGDVDTVNVEGLLSPSELGAFHVDSTSTEPSSLIESVHMLQQPVSVDARNRRENAGLP